MSISAVILSAKPCAKQIAGVEVVNHVSQFTEAKGLLKSRLASIRKVKTDWFFWLDDDDDLPGDYLRVLDKCMRVKAPLAFTNEIVTNADGSSHVRKSSRYTQDRHIHNMTLVHHLAVCRTDVALDAMTRIPNEGLYAVENLLFFEVAKQGASFVNEIGYIWHRRDTGLNRHPSLLIGLVQSATWAHRNRT